MGVPFQLNAIETELLSQIPSGELRASLERSGLPHRRVEAWKWTDLRAQLAKQGYQPGSLDLHASREPDRDASIEARPPLSVMPQIAASLASSPEVFVVTDNETLSLPFKAGEGVSHKHVTVHVPSGVKATILESYDLAGASFANISLRYIVAADAELERVVEQHGSDDGVLVVTSLVELGPRASHKQFTLGFGAKLSRLETYVEHAGDDADLTLAGAYVLGAGRHLDQTTYVRHMGPNGTTEELFKGAVAKSGKGVFQGKIHVDQPAQKTDAQMQHRGLLLEDGGEINAKPELEIYADDVICAHGNALGAIDENALFYMRQRGISEPRARALLTESFLAEPLEMVEDDETRDRLIENVREALYALV